jgi:hypothetical protein
MVVPKAGYLFSIEETFVTDTPTPAPTPTPAVALINSVVAQFEALQTDASTSAADKILCQKAAALLRHQRDLGDP